MSINLPRFHSVVQISSAFIFFTLAITPLLAAPAAGSFTDDIQAREPRRFVPGAGGSAHGHGRRFGGHAAAAASQEARELDDSFELEAREPGQFGGARRFGGGHGGPGARHGGPRRGGGGPGRHSGGAGRRFGRKAAAAAAPQEARDFDEDVEAREPRGGSGHASVHGGHYHPREIDFEEVEGREPHYGPPGHALVRGGRYHPREVDMEEFEARDRHYGGGSGHARRYHPAS